MTRQTSRRAFLRSFASVATAGALAPGLGAAPAHGAAAAAGRLRDFDYGTVELTGGPLKSQYDFIHAHYLGLDIDRLL
jgi:hypothetical protein